MTRGNKSNPSPHPKTLTATPISSLN
uniref:Uncharacterized protein n=1 Tax=Arundo donax TaxID=35708 RepID=A0A0A9AYQ6_ARUDO